MGCLCHWLAQSETARQAQLELDLANTKQRTATLVVEVSASAQAVVQAQEQLRDQHALKEQVVYLLCTPALWLLAVVCM